MRNIGNDQYAVNYESRKIAGMLFNCTNIDTVDRFEYAKFVELSFAHRRVTRAHSFVYRSRCLLNISCNDIVIAYIQFRDPIEMMDH